MNKILKHGLLYILVLSALLFSGCKDIRPLQFNIKYQERKNLFIDNLAQSSGVSDDEKEVLQQMEMILQNDYLELYLGKSCDLAVYDKKNNAVFFSNPNIYFNNGYCSDEDMSPVTVEYYDNSDNFALIPSITNVLKEKVNVTPKTDSVDILYTFGTKPDDRLVPVFSKETFDGYLQKAEQLTDDETISIAQFGRFKMAYSLIEYDLLSPTEKSICDDKYPFMKNLKIAYTLRDDITDYEKDLVLQVYDFLGIDKSVIEKEMIKIGYEGKMRETGAYFEVPLTLSFDGGDLIAEIYPDKIVEQKNYYLTKINFLGSFGAVRKGEEGYLMIMDGSGAIIDTKTDEPSPEKLDIAFYGSDFAINQQNAKELSPYAPFPVFGIKNKDKALFVIAESGEAMAGVSAQLFNDNFYYSKVSPWLNYRMLDYINTSGMDSKATKNAYSEPIMKQPLRLRYHMLFGENADYSAMARYYQEYLLKTGDLQNTQAQNQPVVDLSFMGAFTVKEMRFGIPLDVSRIATSFNEAQDILERLAADGVENPAVRFVGAINGGLDYSVAKTVKVEKSIGGEEGFDKLTQSGNASEVSLAVDFSRVYKKGNGLQVKKDLSKFLDKNYAVIGSYRPMNNQRSLLRTAYEISPIALNGIIESFIGSYKLQSKSLYLRSAASYLSSDYNENTAITREDSKYTWIDAFAKLKAAGFSLVMDGANVYSLKYAERLTDIPVSCSNCRIESYSIPFVGMVLHGYKSYSGPVLNYQGDYTYAMLQTIQSGAVLNYELIYEDPVIFADSSFNDFFSVSVDYNYDRIIEGCFNAKQLLSETSGATIYSHDRIADQVFMTEYSNGVKIIVNFSKSDFVYGEGVIKARSYSLIGGAA